MRAYYFKTNILCVACFLTFVGVDYGLVNHVWLQNPVVV